MEEKNMVEEDEIDLLQLIGVLRRYWKLIAAITTLAALGVLAYSVISLVLPPEKSYLPNLYKPSALILINDDSGGGLSSALASSGLSGLAGLAGVSTGGGGYGNLAIKLLSSKSTLDTIAGEFDMTARYGIEANPVGNTRAAIKGHASFEFDDTTSTLTIAYEDWDPDFAARVVNRIVEILEKRFATIGVNRNINRKLLLEQKLAETEADIETLADEIKRFQSEHSTLDVKTLAQEQITVSAQLRSQLILKEMEIQTYREFSSINDPVIQRLEAERRNITQLLKEMDSGYSEYQDLFPSQQDLPDLAYRFARLERELKVQEQVYTTLRGQYEVARLNSEGEEPIFQLLELADPPDLKSGPSRGVLSIVVTMAAFFLSIFLVFVLNAVRNIKNDPEAMKRLKGEV